MTGFLDLHWLSDSLKDPSWLRYCGLWPMLQMASENLTSSAPPLFVKGSDIVTSGGTSISPYDMCNASTRTTGLTKLVGVQKINNLWRIYLTDTKTRLETFLKKHILIDGKDMPLYNQSRSTSHPQMRGERKHIPLSNEKLTIKYVPMSISNDKNKAMPNIPCTVSHFEFQLTFITPHVYD